MMNNLPWLFLLLPLVVAAIDWLCFSKSPRTAATLSILSVVATFVLCCHLLFCGGNCTPDAYTWLPCGGDVAKSLSMGLVLDPLALRMMLVVTGILRNIRNRRINLFALWNLFIHFQWIFFLHIIKLETLLYL